MANFETQPAAPVAAPPPQAPPSYVPPNPPPSRGSAVITGLIVLVLICGTWGAAYFGLLRDKWKTERAVAARLAERQQVLAQLRAGGAMAGHADELKDQNWVASQRIPTSLNISDLRDEISRQAALSGLVLQNFEEKAEVPLAQVIEVPVKVLLAGEYRNLVGFLERLAVLPRLIAVKDIHLSVFSTTQEKVTLAATLTLAAYKSR